MQQKEGGVATTAEAARRVALRCENVNRWFGGLHALKGPDLAIFQGEIFGLVGPNGSGKTTLVNTVTGFYPPQKGRVFLFDEQINGYDWDVVSARKVDPLGLATLVEIRNQPRS